MLPLEVLALGRRLAARTGIDAADGISFAAEAWGITDMEVTGMTHTLAYRWCVNLSRATNGRPAQAHNGRASTVHPCPQPLDVFERVPAAEDPGFHQVEVRHDLAAAIGCLCDADLAALARYWWLGLPAKTNSPEDRARVRAMLHARRANQQEEGAPC